MTSFIQNPVNMHGLPYVSLKENYLDQKPIESGVPQDAFLAPNILIDVSNLLIALSSLRIMFLAYSVIYYTFSFISTNSSSTVL